MLLPRVRVAALIPRENAILLALHEKDGRRVWVLPGGGVDPGESMVDALKRELLEELGLAIVPKAIVHACEAIDPQGSRHLIQLSFLCECRADDHPRATGIDPRVVDAHFVSCEDIPRLDIHPPIQTDLALLMQQGFPHRLPLPANRWVNS
ncbi:MAG TPA: NUDIX hydrolase [Candidatus Hydrogenedentes bacterium]|nr:NUDIX hydrolase [Candidatus Hydrogenedentota bacterium]